MRRARSKASARRVFKTSTVSRRSPCRARSRKRSSCSPRPSTKRNASAKQHPMPSADLVVSVVVAGLLTGLVYGLMALGLSVIFGVMRIVNFAHGELMTLAMYATAIMCTSFSLDPFVVLVPVAVGFFGLGYALQSGVINRFITKPEHVQFLLLLALATILANGQLMVFGPDAYGVQTEYQLDAIELG